MTWARLLVEVCGGRVTCPRPLPWRYPSGFAGVCFAIVLGLGVRWPVRGLLVDALWPLWVSMVQAFWVFEGVGGCAGRGVGGGAGRGWCRWRGTSVCSSMFEGVGGCAGRRLGRLVACLWTTSACSRVWPRLVAVVWVVSVVWVACWWTTFVVVGWAFWVFEVVGGAAGRRLGRRGVRGWSSRVWVRRASEV